ncbi:hypothetical protein Q9233_004236 [Columba guinea]|nr:hypothetical protein Q9233_004236 [Columba guinea]
MMPVDCQALSFNFPVLRGINVAKRFQEEWTRDTAAPVCRKDQDHLPKLTKSRSARLNQAVPGPRAAVQSVDTIHVVEVYGHTDSCNKPNCRIPG